MNYTPFWNCLGVSGWPRLSHRAGVGAYDQNDDAGMLNSQASMAEVSDRRWADSKRRCRIGPIRSTRRGPSALAAQQSFTAAAKLVSQSLPQAGNRPAGTSQGRV